MTDIIILNGGSSSGKTSIAKSLQDLLPTPWLRFSIDDLIDAMPRAMLTSHTGILFHSDGVRKSGNSIPNVRNRMDAGDCLDGTRWSEGYCGRRVC